MLWAPGLAIGLTVRGTLWIVIECYGGQLLEYSGERRFYEVYDRDLLRRDWSLLDFVEKIYQELEGKLTTLPAWKHYYRLGYTSLMSKGTITLFPIAGKQFFFNVPDRWCKECDLTHQLIEKVTADYENIEIEVKPWLENLPKALIHGGWHPPVVLVNGKLFSQGVVPNERILRNHLNNLFH